MPSQQYTTVPSPVNGFRALPPKSQLLIMNRNAGTSSARRRRQRYSVSGGSAIHQSSASHMVDQLVRDRGSDPRRTLNAASLASLTASGKPPRIKSPVPGQPVAGCAELDNPATARSAAEADRLHRTTFSRCSLEETRRDREIPPTHPGSHSVCA
jgi:hypothetical protein